MEPGKGKTRKDAWNFTNMIPLLVLINGLPCSGKTVVARQIKQQFNLPFISKDEIKECLFDSLGWSDLEWSHRLSIASKEILFYLIENDMAEERSLGVDCNFLASSDTSRIRAIKDAHPFHPLQVICWAPGEILVQRFRQRIGTRHPGHQDSLLVNAIEADLLTSKIEPLDIGGDLFEFDTSQKAGDQLSALFSFIRRGLDEINPL
jgi:predicted ABC-type ATPase